MSHCKRYVAPARTYYVDDTNGLDSNRGNSEEAPWKTISKVNGSSFKPGDRILFKRGESWNERFVIPSSGKAGRMVSFQAYGSGNDPEIDGSGISITPTAGLVEISSKHHVRLMGFHVINSDDAGIEALNSNNIDIQYNSTRDTHSSGIGVWGTNTIWVSYNTIVNARCVTLAAGGHEESISIGADTTNFDVSHNDISMDGVEGYLGNEGIDCKDGANHGEVHHNYIHGYTSEGGAVYVDGWNAAYTGDINIYCNRCWGNPNGIAINSEAGGPVQNINIFNNLVYNVYSAGINISHTGSDGSKSDIDIYHNTIYKNQYNGGAAIFVTSENVSNISIINNITYFGGSNGQIVAGTDTIADHITAYNNLSYGSTSCSLAFPDCIELSENPVGYPDIHDNLTDDPDFVSLVTPDLHIQSTSPAISAAADLGLPLDFDGKTRPQGAGVDIGAYEYIE